MGKFLTLSFILHSAAAALVVFGVPLFHLPENHRISVSILMDAPLSDSNAVANRQRRSVQKNPHKRLAAPPKTEEEMKADATVATAPLAEKDHYHADPADPNAVAEAPGAHALSEPSQVVADESAHSHGLIDENSAYLKSVIELVSQAKRYPKISQDREEEGLVLLAVAVSGDGNIKDVRVEQTCPFERLNRAAVDTVRGIAKFPPPPGLPSAGLATLHIPIRYKLLRR